MRLIDADALETHEQMESLGNGQYEYVEVVYKDDIDNAPTIDPPAKCIAEIHLDPDKVIEKIKEDYYMPYEWIPVSDHLPEEGTEALGTDIHGCIRHVVKDKSGLYEFATYEEMMHIDIVAWTRLPEPWKGE